MATPPVLLRPDIPTEIYLAIADYLPAASIAALILANKHLLQLYGSKHWKALQNDPSELAAFLLLLERDLEEYYYSKPLLRKRLPKSTPHNCTDSEVQYANSTKYSVLAKHFNYTITWPHLILALKQGLYGSNHGLALDALNHTATTTITPSSDPSDTYTIQLSINPRLVTGRLLLRCGYRISSALHAIKPSDLKNLDLFLCRHVGTASRSSPWYDNTLSQLLSGRCYTYHNDDDDDTFENEDEDNDGEDNSSFMLLSMQSVLDDIALETFSRHCCFCMTDYILAPNLDDGSYTITTWQNLGDSNYYGGPDLGQKTSPRDPRSNAWTALADAEPGREHLCRVLVYPKGCVREAYGRGNGEKLAEIDRAV